MLAIIKEFVNRYQLDMEGGTNCPEWNITFKNCWKKINITNDLSSNRYYDWDWIFIHGSFLKLCCFWRGKKLIVIVFMLK